MKNPADTAIVTAFESSNNTSYRREFLKMAGTGMAAMGVLSVTGGVASGAAPAHSTALPNGADNFYTSDKVTVQKVTFKNQYHMLVAGNLFTPKTLDRTKRTPAIVVGHPMGAVKEQSANLYATKMAEQGYVTLSMDIAFWGGSEGQPRNAVLPDMYAESFSAGVDFLSSQAFVDPQQVGAIGVCGSGSFVISAAKIDPRMKAIATVSMYDMGAVNRNALHQSQTIDQRNDPAEDD